VSNFKMQGGAKAPFYPSLPTAMIVDLLWMLENSCHGWHFPEV